MTQPATRDYTITPEKNPSNGRIEFAVRFGAAHMGYVDSNLGAEKLAQEIARKRAEAAELEAQERAALVAETRQPAQKRRRKQAPACPCPLCQPSIEADGIHWCKQGKEFVAFHAGLYVASAGHYLLVSDKLNQHRHSLLVRPLPDATPEEVAEVLAAA